MALYGTSLNAVTVIGPGSAIIFDEPKSSVSMQVAISGTGNASVTLEGSLDGVNFFTVTSDTYTAPEVLEKGDSGHGPMIAVRANITSISPGAVVTVSVAAE